MIICERIVHDFYITETSDVPNEENNTPECADEDETDACKEEEEPEYDWHVTQTCYEEQTVSMDAPKYGFANSKSGVFNRLQVNNSKI